MSEFIRDLSAMMMNVTSSLSRKQAMSPVNGQQSQSVPGSETGGSNSANNMPMSDGSLHRHVQQHHLPPHGQGMGHGDMGHLDSPGADEVGERRPILPPCPLAKPPRGKRKVKTLI